MKVPRAVERTWWVMESRRLSAVKTKACQWNIGPSVMAAGGNTANRGDFHPRRDAIWHEIGEKGEAAPSSSGLELFEARVKLAGNVSPCHQTSVEFMQPITAQEPSRPRP